MYDRFRISFYILVFIIGSFFSPQVVFSASSTSTVNITAVVPSSGGGGGGVDPTPTEVDFFGKAYPNSKVTILKDAQFVEQTTASSDSDFEIVLLGLVGGTYLFSFYTEDIYETRSDLVTMSINVINEAKTTVSGIFLPPTVNTDKTSVVQGNELTIFGQTFGYGDVIIEINAASTSSSTVIMIEADNNGLYEYVLDTTLFSLGDYSVKAKTNTGVVETPYGKTIVFSIDEKEIIKPPFLMADLNDDGKVDIIDFSIAAFWYKRTLSEAFLPIEAERLNGDGKIDLIDFSMIAYYWTG